MRHLCVPQGLAVQDIAKFEELISGTRNVRRGEALYRVGDPFSHLYAVRSGSFKSVMNRPNGREQVTGFSLAGEPLGLDGIFTDTHALSVIALEDSSVCMVPYVTLRWLCGETPWMQDRLCRLWGDQLARESSWAAILGSCNAGERVAAFLLDVSDRYGERGYSHTEFNLSMTRAEMGSRLGLALESVSRTLSKIQQCGLVDVRGKLVRIIDAEGLRRFAQTGDSGQTEHGAPSNAHVLSAA